MAYLVFKPKSFRFQSLCACPLFTWEFLAFINPLLPPIPPTVLPFWLMGLVPLQAQKLKLSKPSLECLISYVSQLPVCSLSCVQRSHAYFSILKEATLVTRRTGLTVSTAELLLSPVSKPVLSSHLLAPHYVTYARILGVILGTHHMSHLIQIFSSLPPTCNPNPFLSLLLQGLHQVISFLSRPLLFASYSVFLLSLLSPYNPFPCIIPSDHFIYKVGEAIHLLKTFQWLSSLFRRNAKALRSPIRHWSCSCLALQTQLYLYLHLPTEHFFFDILSVP